MRGDGNTCARAAPILTGRSSADAACDSIVASQHLRAEQFSDREREPDPDR